VKRTNGAVERDLAALIKRGHDFRDESAGIEPDRRGVAEDGCAPQGDLSETESGRERGAREEINRSCTQGIFWT
jgi:hypothetical protein